MTQMVDGRPHNVNAGALRNAGVEAQVAWRIARDWSVDANYSFLHMENPVVASLLTAAGMCPQACSMWRDFTLRSETVRCRRISYCGI